MSYNIDTWRTKKLENLQIPLGAFFPVGWEMWHPEKEWMNENELTLTFCGAAEIHGKVIDAIFHIDKVEFYGEGSGTSMHDIFEPALKRSAGTLIASCVWEGGDSINKLIVEDGNVNWEDIEI